MQRFLRVAALAVALIASATRPSDAQPAPDPAARGLDVFVHGTDHAPSGSLVRLDVQAFGFPTATTMAPLPDARLEAVWDPEHLGKGVHAAPPPVSVTADSSGRAVLAVPVPEGGPLELKLLLGVRSGTHQRTTALRVQRTARASLLLQIADQRVVPGSTISAWVRATEATTGGALGGAGVEVSLLEGGSARHTVAMTTDAAGVGLVRVPIPRTDEPAFRWTLRARLVDGTNTASASVELRPREETPGKPRMTASWERASVLAGERAHYRIDVRDGTDQPVIGAAVRTWVGPKGTSPPKDDKEWLSASRLVHSDASGAVAGTFEAPSTVLRGIGSTLTLVAKVNVDGYALEQRATSLVGLPSSSAEIVPEASTIVPGVEQRVLLRVRDGKGAGVSGSFVVEGDGLREELSTNAEGEVEFTWKAPLDVGATRKIGPCAGGVAATVRVRPLRAIAALGRTDPFDLCVSVDRDAAGLLLVDRAVARMGDTLHIALRTSGGRRGRPEPWSIVLRSEDGATTAIAWLEDEVRGVAVPIPRGAPGLWTVSAASPGTARAARVLGRGVFVAPRVTPRLRVVAQGRPAPGGTVVVDGELTDDGGRPLTGTVALVLHDLHGGGSAAGLERLDTRGGLCARAGVATERCVAFLDGGSAEDPLRRALVAEHATRPTPPVKDPGAHAQKAMNEVFRNVLRSLEGAVFEASESADRLRDVRRKTAKGSGFNPELLTLVTAAIDPPPTTPGGEPVTLPDLLAVDPQVTFDNAARRVTRLKLFRVLSAVREWKRDSHLESDEPVFKNPNAILRRLVREGRLDESLLLDPWGGTIQFVASGGPSAPFLTVVKGFELRAPGPDGRVSTGDDVRDPFERVVRSGTPYAKALDEDRIVDAKYEMEVAEATVSGWQRMFDELTGTALGLRGIGEGGGGRGEGIGLGGIGTIGHGAGRGTAGISFASTAWSPPIRTDANGRVRFEVPLESIETTWRIALVAVADGGAPASGFTDVQTSLPLSVRVDTGARWVEGDVVRAVVTVHNRTAKTAHASLEVNAAGTASLADPREARYAMDIPAGSSKRSTVAVRAARPGRASLDVVVRSESLPDDRVTHAWDVVPAGEPTDLMQAQWVHGDAALRAPVDASMRLSGKPVLVLERGFERILDASLESLDPDRLGSPKSLADAVEVAARVGRFAFMKEGDGKALSKRATRVARLAVGRLVAMEAASGNADGTVRRRALQFAPDAALGDPGPPACPSDATATLEDRIAELETEPPSASGATLACWDAFAATTLQKLSTDAEAPELARGVLAFADRPHRKEAAAALAERLRSLVKLRPSGGVSLPAFAQAKRSDRATVFAALLRATTLGRRGIAPPDRLLAWIAVQQDKDGSFGTTSATRAVVRALVASPWLEKGTSTVTVDGGGAGKTFELGPSARVVVPLASNVSDVRLATSGPGVLARLERPVLRLWRHPPDELASPVRFELTWPSDAKALSTGVLRVQIRHGFPGTVPLDVRIPLPPGVSLAAPVDGIRQVQGVLAIRHAVPSSMLPTLIEIPIRFGLAGRVTTPEARAGVAFEEVPRAVAPARPLTIR